MSDHPKPSHAASQAASVLIEALKLTDEIDAVAAELTLVDEQPTQSTFAAEFESSAGTAAFLVYVFSFSGASGDRTWSTARAAFDDALATLQTAAERDAPGPRLVAHATLDDVGLILATSPTVLRALRGEAAAIPPPPRWPSAAARAKARREQAERLLRTLRAADRAAEQWLTAAGDGSLDASPAEVELALFLNDERSIRHLLHALNVVLSATPKRTG